MSFTAKYNGTCESCGERIRADIDEIEYTEADELVHVDCDDSGELEPAEPPLCSDCFMHHAGECL